MMVSLVVSMPADLANQLESLARSRRVSRSAFVRDTLSLAVCGKPVKLEYQPRGNRDGLEDAARVYINANIDLSVRALEKGLADLGITRKKTWVSDARSAIRGCGAKRTEGAPE